MRCCVTDGVFGTYTTMVPYMRKWIAIYSKRYLSSGLVPAGITAWWDCTALRRIGRERHCRFPHLEQVIGKLSPRPLLMIHGGGDTYIKPDMAQALFERARQPKELWLVEGAKHNQALQVAGDEYRRRVLEFFQAHLAEPFRRTSRFTNSSVVHSSWSEATSCRPWKCCSYRTKSRPELQ